MPLQVKQKQAAKTAVASQHALLPVIDELGEIQAEIAKLKKSAAVLKLAKLAEREQELKGVICDEFDDFDLADVETKIEASQYVCKIGVMGNKRLAKEGAAPKMMELLGPDTYYKLAKVNLSDLDKYLTPDQVAQVLDKERTSTRTIKVTKRA